MFAFFKERRRARSRAREFPPRWNEYLARNVPYVSRLVEADRAELRGHIQVFLDEKRFEGCAGLEITDEIRVTVAAQACVLLLHRRTDYYPQLDSILIYPSTFVVPEGGRMPGGMVMAGPQARLGESWVRGAVVLAWDNVLAGAADIHDGHNVVLHEFAHQLDQESGGGDGAPALPRRSAYVAWARVLGHEYDQLVRQAERRHRTLIDQYGATNPAEFFAVVTETFFEKPHELRARHAELYQQMQEFYLQDPAGRLDEARRPS
jgi:Mlc titration factor MtfA (ptsG expression regulator)